MFPKSKIEKEKASEKMFFVAGGLTPPTWSMDGGRPAPLVEYASTVPISEQSRSLCQPPMARGCASRMCVNSVRQECFQECDDCRTDDSVANSSHHDCVCVFASPSPTLQDMIVCVFPLPRAKSFRRFQDGIVTPDQG